MVCLYSHVLHLCSCFVHMRDLHGWNADVQLLEHWSVICSYVDFHYCSNNIVVNDGDLHD